jgi:hypothetical protein
VSNGSITEYAPGKKRRGRPRTTELYATQIRDAENLVADHLPKCVHNLIALADGVWVEEIGPEGDRTVYKTPPDRASNQYLIDRMMGKPTEALEVSGADGEPLYALADRASNPRDAELASSNGHTNGDGRLPS